MERNPQLQGTKRRVAMERELLVARGRGDGRTVLMVPEVKGSQCTGITLVHVVFADRLPAPVARAVLQGWDRRYDRLVDWVTETEGGFRDDLLAEIPVVDLLTMPVSDLAERWRELSVGDRRRPRPGRHRALPRGAGPAARRCASGCSPTASWPWRPPAGIRCPRWPCASRPRRR